MLRQHGGTGAQISTNDFRNGLNVEIEGVPYKVIPLIIIPHAS